MSEQNQCGKEALSLFTWPGHDPMPICSDHHSWMVQVAGAMGLYVSTTKAPLGSVCTQVVSKAAAQQE